MGTDNHETPAEAWAVIDYSGHLTSTHVALDLATAAWEQLDDRDDFYVTPLVRTDDRTATAWAVTDLTGTTQLVYRYRISGETALAFSPLGWHLTPLRPANTEARARAVEKPSPLTAANDTLRKAINAALDAADRAGVAVHHLDAQLFPMSEASTTSVSLMSFDDPHRRQYTSRSLAYAICAQAGIDPDVLYSTERGRGFMVMGDPNEQLRVYCRLEPAGSDR